MKKIYFSALVLLLLAACNSKPNSNPGDSAPTVTTDSIPVQSLIGSYVGMFGDNKITVMLTKVSPDSVTGRSIVAGNDRPFNGTFTSTEHQWNFNLKEPGDHKDDGVFNFTIFASNIDSMTGSWQAYDTKRPPKTYDLTRKEFKYDINNGQYAYASQRLLEPADVENMYKTDLTIMRNEIYARHGYSFSKRDIRQYFETTDWYVPVSTDVQKSFTQIEIKNIALIKRYEKYADDYGDEYGR